MDEETEAQNNDNTSKVTGQVPKQEARRWEAGFRARRPEAWPYGGTGTSTPR